ncbi:VWA domain-containing protein [Halapricum sp. CBA1109]|uniref:PKD domain-containing protein n=1 Tax=Halapricum sp. CBA1109 TaxID=2668068 RepID=UPI0012F9D618|nr:PKD domain-containing protein [Halapricum sp. CBA1109]MUV89227.1 VWA domain-containing protein [Halapricum sp. CBA1109]
MLALQGGGVWQQTDDGVRMVDRPNLEMADGQLKVTLTDIRKRNEAISKGDIIATRNVESSRDATRELMSELSTVWREPGVDKVDVEISVRSDFAPGWADYVESNMGDDASVSRTDDDRVEITIDDIEADRSGSGGASSSGTTTSSSGTPPLSTGGSTSVDDSTGGSTTGGTDTAGDTSPSGSGDDTATTNSSADDGSTDVSDGDGRDCNTDDHDRGHGNDCDGVDEDNPSDRSKENRRDVVDDSDGDGIVDRHDDCPETYGLGADGCPLTEGGDGGSVTVNADAGDLTYLGTQSGVTNETEFSSVEYRDPMDVAFVLDESGSMLYDPTASRYEYEYVEGPGTVTVPSDMAAVKEEWVRYGPYAWWDFVSYHSPGERITLDRGERLELQPAGNDPNGERIDATRSFLDSLNDSMDRAAAVQFTADAQTPYSLTGDLDAVKNLETDVGGNTNIAAGIRDGLEQVGDSPDDRNKVMVVLSDGRDNTGEDPVSAARAAAAEGVTIYSVGLGDGVDTGQLQGIASTTGGQYYHADDAGELEEKFQQIVADSQTNTVRAIDHAPITMSVTAGSAGGDLGASGFGSAVNLNDPRTVDPVDPSPRTYDLEGIEGGSTLAVTTTTYASGDRYDSDITQTNGGNEYVHRGAKMGSEETTTTGYEAYTDGDSIDSAATEWWQRSEATLLDDVGASIEDGEVVLPENDQALIRTATPNGYALLLFDAENVDRPPVAIATASDAEPSVGEAVTIDASESYDPDAGDEVSEYKFGDGEWQDAATTTETFTKSRNVTVAVRTDDGQTGSTTVPVTVANQPVIANLTASKSGITVGESITVDAGDSRDPDDGESVVDYTWSGVDIADGTASDTVTFDSKGTKTVTVTVESEDGTTASTSVEIDVNNEGAVAAFEYPTSVSTGETVTLDAGPSYDPTSGEDIDSYDWSGDGPVDGASGETPDVTFSSPGSYDVELTVESEDGTTDTASATIDVGPSAELEADQSTVFEGESVAFEVDPDGWSVDSWSVSGGDEVLESDSGTDRVYSFTDEGTKTVSVTITDGSDTETLSVEVTVENRKPVAVLEADAGTGDDTTVALDASGSYDLDAGDNATLSYSFAAVSTPSGSSASVTDTTAGDGQATFENLDESGAYVAEITVTDDNGATASTDVLISYGSSSTDDATPVDISVVEVDVDNDD